MTENGGPLRIAVPFPAGENYENYLDALARLGAEGVRVDADADPAAFDGLLLPGGGDVDPARYGAANCGSAGIDPALDRLQFTVAERMIRAGVPTLGICRGHQVLNVFFGGTLIQDLAGRARHARDAGVPEDKVHGVAAAEGSWMEALYGPRFCVNSSHHQAVDGAGVGLEMDLYSEDGVVEAMHHRSLPVWSVQWHPERMCFAHAREDTVDGSRVLSWFLARCAGTGRRKG